MSEKHNILSAIRTLETERNGLEAASNALQGQLGVAFEEACCTIKDIAGRVIVTGMGKSGHIGTKLAATLASTGTPAFFVHPAEANHGDLGMIARDDVIIALSWSGEAAELKGVLTYSSRFSIPLIAITSNSKSTLGKEATICLELPKEKEACPNGLAPTTSTIMQMAIGDALSVALLEGRGFSADDFGVYHPGGSLGASLTRISDIMHTDDEMPLINLDQPLGDAVERISERRFGCVGVVRNDGSLCGIITDGDINRSLRDNMNQKMGDMKISDVMSPDPKTVTPETLATAAMAILNEKSINALFVIEKDKPTGLVHLHDLLKIGVA